MLPFPWLVLIAIVVLPLLWAVWLTQVISFSFARLGLSPEATLLILLFSLIGGWVNIPLWRRRLHLPDLERFDAQLLSIGGAGVHDGIFFAGVLATLLA
jgi:uncharacterized membrane protein